MEINRLFLLFCAAVFIPSDVKSLADPCTTLTTCGACIRVPNCVWCSKTVRITFFKKCFNSQVLTKNAKILIERSGSK